MKKSLVALAVAASVTAPAMAQVTISGFFNASYDTHTISSPNVNRVGRLSEDRVTDNSSRIIFNANEDLGGGMRAIGQFDLRVAMDAMQPINPVDPGITGLGAAAGTNQNRPNVNVINGGNNHVGLATSNYGTFRLGRQDVQYVENATFNPVGMATIANHAGVFHGVGTTAMTNATRTANLMWWVSPRWNGIEATVGFSTNPIGSSSDAVQAENDLAKTGVGARKGGGTYFKLDSDLGKLRVVYSQIDFKSDYTGLAQTAGGGGTRTAASATATAASADYTGAALPDHNGKVLTGKYNLGNGWNVGLGLSRNKTTAVLTGVSTTQNGTQYGLGYTTGAHQVGVSYTTASDQKTSNNGITANTGVSIITLAYGYNLSKRTQIHASYVSLDNETAATSGLFYNAASVMGNASALAGERHSAYSLGIRHSF
jgi:predicted porin